MTNTKSTADEIVSLVQQTQEHVKYLQELGVTGFVTTESEPLSQAMPAPVDSRRSYSAAAQAEPVLTVPARHQREAALTRQAEPPERGLSQDSLFGDLLPPPPTFAKSNETLKQISADVGDCTRCPLYEGRTNIVHTEGSHKARLMFVGEAPGADEDAQARPFVGRAGQLLTKIIESLGLKREEVLIGNVNRCRPPGNRAPTPDEAAACKPFLLREIASVAPEVIVVLGNTAMKNLLEVKEGITRLRGIFQDYKGLKVMPTFHPAYLLRDPSKKRETWEDLKKVRDYLDNTPKKQI